MLEFLNKSVAGANICSAVESETTQKNEVSPKNHRSRAITRLLVLFFLLLLSGTSICLFGQELIAKKNPNGKWGFVDINGIVVIPFKYDRVRDFKEGIAAVKHNGNWGCIDITSALVVPMVYLYAIDAIDAIDDAKRKRKTEALEPEKTKQEMIPFNSFAQNYMVQEMNKWLQKGEFEKTADWELRISDNNRKAQSAKLLKKAEQLYIHIAEYSNNLSIGNISLGAYDADNEMFLITSSIYGSFWVPVPVNEAPNFKDNWKRLIKPKYGIVNDQIALVGFIREPIEVAVVNNNATEQKENQTPVKSSSAQPEVAVNTPITNNNNVVFTRKGEVGIGLSSSIYANKEISMFGFCGKLQVGIANSVRLEGAFTYHLKTIELLMLSMWDVKLNMQTIVTKGDTFILYPLIGLGVSGMGVKVPTLGGVKDKDGPFFSMNFGAGFDVKLSKRLFFNLEPKYMLLVADGATGHGFVGSLGFIFKF